MSECELARGLRVELEEARKKNEEIKKDLEEILEDRIEVIGERMNAISKLSTLEIVLGNVRSELETVTKERDSLREEIARRDAEKPVTALSWIEKTDARLEKIEARINEIIRTDDLNMKSVHKRIDALAASCKDYEERSRHDALNHETRLNAISSRLDGSTGLEFRVGAMDAKFMGCVEGLNSRIDRMEKEIKARFAKLEARVSKKRVKKP